jgi:pimeloyl-ACP methyl ester carboxylesterase
MNGRALHATPIGEPSTRPPSWPYLSRIEVPVLVAVGEYDLPGILKQCGELVAALPRADLVEIPHSAHCPQLDQADILTSTVLEFLDQQVGDGLVDPDPP